MGGRTSKLAGTTTSGISIDRTPPPSHHSSPHQPSPHPHPHPHPHPPTPGAVAAPIPPPLPLSNKSNLHTPHVISITTQSSTRDSMSQGVRSHSDRLTSLNIQSSLFHSDDDSNDVDDPLSTTSTSHLDDPYLPHLHSQHITRISRRSSSFANCQNCNAVCIPRVICNAKHVYCGGDCYWSYTIRHESDQPHPVPRHNNTFADATPLSQALADDGTGAGAVVDIQDRWASRPEAVVTQPIDVSAASTLVDKPNLSSSSSTSSLRIHPSQRSHRRQLSRNTTTTLAPIQSPVAASPSLPMSSASSHIEPLIVHDDDTPDHSPHEEDVSMVDNSREPTQTSTSQQHHDMGTPEHDFHIDAEDDDEGYDQFETNVIHMTTTTRHPNKKHHIRHSISHQPLPPHASQQHHQRRHSDLVKSSSRPILIPTPPMKPQPSPYLYVRT